MAILTKEELNALLKAALVSNNYGLTAGTLSDNLNQMCITIVDKYATALLFDDETKQEFDKKFRLETKLGLYDDTEYRLKSPSCSGKITWLRSLGDATAHETGIFDQGTYDNFINKISLFLKPYEDQYLLNAGTSSRSSPIDCRK